MTLNVSNFAPPVSPAIDASSFSSFFYSASIWLSWLDQTYPGIVPAILTGLVTGTIALIALHTNAAVNLRNKRIDVIINCNARYDELYKSKIVLIQEALRQRFKPDEDKLNLLPKSIDLKEDITLYFRRFWGVKSDQLDYWLSGYIDPETMISWFMSTIDAIHLPIEAWAAFPGVTKGGGWEAVRGFHEVTNPRLFQVVETISEKRFKKMSADDRYAELFQLFGSIEREEAKLIRMLKRNTHSRLTMRRFEGKLPPSIATALAEKRQLDFIADHCSDINFATVEPNDPSV